MKVYMKSSRGDGYVAYGVYDNGKITVKKGSTIRLEYSNNFRRSHKAADCRNDPSCVDQFGNVLKDCIFKSPSTAAQFVNGHSTDGYIAWRVNEKMRLKDWLEQEREKNAK